ncbi:MAG: DUF5685 family protein [Clostridia bacterium]|nr:DUF5685 family protein [Clostridia bacterium]
MFGYVNISKDTVTEEDKALYQSYYCGLCKAIGKKSQVFRMGLNNDLTFLAILLAAVIPDEPETKKNQSCIAHHIKKHDEIVFDKIMDYVSDMNILLVYLKICDDAKDSKQITKTALRGVLSKKADSILARNKNLGDCIIGNLDRLSALEKENSASIDETADCFAKILEAIFVPDFIEDDSVKKIMAWIGYNIGRWIYIVDAYDDIERDRKSKNYNPFLSAGTEDSEHEKKSAYDALVYTLGNAANAYDLLTVYRNDTLLKNILYTGLYGKMNSIFTGMEEKDEPV